MPPKADVHVTRLSHQWLPFVLLISKWQHLTEILCLNVYFHSFWKKILSAIYPDWDLFHLKQLLFYIKLQQCLRARIGFARSPTKLYKTCSRCKKDTWHVESKHLLQPPNYPTITVNRIIYVNNIIAKNRSLIHLDLYGLWSEQLQTRMAKTYMATNQNSDKPDRSQTETVTNRRNHKPKRPQTRMATNTETATGRNGHKP